MDTETDGNTVLIESPCRTKTVVSIFKYPQRRNKVGFKGLKKLGILIELWDFMKERKKYWLAPILIFLFLFSILIVLSQGSAIAPFIYTIF